MVLDLRQNFVFVQYLENKLAEFHQILCNYLYWQDLGWGCYLSFFANLYQSYGPWLQSEFRFRPISWEQIDRTSPYFISLFILTRSRLGLFPVIFLKFVPELWPLIAVRISFPLYILRTNLTKFYICIDNYKISVGIISCHFCSFVTELWSLIYVRISFPFNIWRTHR